MVITPKSLTIVQLLSAESEQYVVPAYQRRYSWHEKQLGELLDDISLLEGSDTHLLGSIVCLTGFHKAGINKLELVDGQQRLTTICILLHCIAERLNKDGENKTGQEIEHLLTAKALGEPPEAKIILDSLDSAQFELHIAGNEIENPDNRNLALAFATFRKWASAQALKDLGSFLYHLRNQCIVIRLDVSDAKDAFKLFETINNRGLRLSPTDIIKNFILGNAARFGPEALKLARGKWAELLRHLDGTSIETFFRHFLCARLKRRITRSFVIPNFKIVFMHLVAEAAQLPERKWYEEDDAPEEVETDDADSVPEAEDEVPESALAGISTISFAAFLDLLVTGAKAYGQLMLCRTGNAVLDRHLRNLKMIKSLQTYGFLMAMRVGGCPDDVLAKVLRLTEAFLLRRHICKERANENEMVFARLCAASPANPLPDMLEEFRRYCPSDEKFQQDFAAFSFTSSLIDRARFCLEQFELSRKGSHLELLVAGAESVHVEHIIPIKIKTKKAKEEYGDWPTYLGQGAEAKHPRFVTCIGNLTLFAGPLNISASNNPYEKKKACYKESALTLTKSLPEDYPDFRFEQVEARARKLAEQAVRLWPAP